MISIRRLFSFALCLSVLSGVTTSPTVYAAQPKAKVIEPKAKPSEEKLTEIVENLAPVTFYEARNPETKELIRFQYQPTPRAELLRFVPKANAQIVGVPPSKGVIGSSGQFVADFIPEYVAFTIALAISASVHYENDPTFFKSFVDQNLSVTGVGSFAGFLLGSRASQKLLQLGALAYDPRLAPKELLLHTPVIPGQLIDMPILNEHGVVVASAKVPTRAKFDWMNTRPAYAPTGPTWIQNKFTPLVGPLGLASGMIVSNLIHEAIADKNMQLCVRATYFKKTLPQGAKAPKNTDIDEACERAWDDWRFSKKLADYTPDMLAMAGVSLFQAYMMNPVLKAGYGKVKQVIGGQVAKRLDTAGVAVFKESATRYGAVAIREGAEKIVPVVLRGARVAGFIGGLASGMTGRIIMTAANVLTFMEISHYVTPWIKVPFERQRQGRDITNRINEIYTELDRTEKNKWVWAPRVPDASCGEYVADPMGAMMPDPACYIEEQHDPAFQLKKMARVQAKWREQILSEAYAAQSSWQTYVSEFATMYANARTFYTYIASMIRFEKVGKIPTPLYSTSPFHGVYVDPASKSDDDTMAALVGALEYLEAYMATPEYRSRKNSLLSANRADYTELPQILNGLRAINPNIPLASLDGGNLSSVLNLGTISKEQRENLEASVRNRLLSDAVSRITKVLRDDQIYGDQFVQPHTPHYEADAKWNPFMALRLKLGDPNPLARGIALLRTVNDAPDIIAPDTKLNSPGRIGLVKTETMVDYLVASMVCGPEVDPRYSKADRIRIYRDRKSNTFSRIKDTFGLGKRPLTGDETEVLISVKEYSDEALKAQRNWFPTFNPTVLVSESIGFSAEFHPPRIVTGVPQELCRQRAFNKSTGKEQVYDGYSAKWFVNGITYNGLLDIIRENVRPELIGNQMPPEDKNQKWTDPFETWWDANTEKDLNQMLVRFRSEYRTIVKKKFIPALTLRETDASRDYNGHNFKLGALESLYDEAELYLKIAGQLGQVSKDKASLKAHQGFQEKVLLDLKSMGALVADLELVIAKGSDARTQFELRKTTLEKDLETLKSLSDSRQTAISASADVIKANEQIQGNMKALLGEMESYWSIIRAVQVAPNL